MSETDTPCPEATVLKNSASYPCSYDLSVSFCNVPLILEEAIEMSPVCGRAFTTFTLVTAADMSLCSQHGLPQKETSLSLG